MDESPGKQERQLPQVGASDTAAQIETDNTVPLDHNDEIQFSLDQLATQTSRLNFQVRIKRAERQHSFQISIDFDQLPATAQQCVKFVLEQYADWSARERSSALSWLLEQALRQQGLNKEDREAQIRTLLLCDPQSSSYKENYYDLCGERFLLEFGGREFFEQTKTLWPYNEVYQSWRAAVNNKLVIWLPKGLSEPNSLKDRQDFELLLLGLRHGKSLPAVIAQHAELIDKWDADQAFRTAMGRTIEKRHVPDETGCSLEHWLLATWRHSCLWLLDNRDRALVLGNRLYARINVSEDAIRKAVDKLGLKGYEKFQQPFTQAPCYVELYRGENPEQGTCQIVPRSVGKV